MPGQSTYTVKFPDGYVQQFDGPDNMSDADAFTRATQERAVKSGKIQTTWFGGAAKQMGQERAANTALIGGAGLASGFAAPVVLAPIAARWIDYFTKSSTGEQANKPTIGEQGLDLLEGAAAVVPGRAVGMLDKFAESTVPHVSSITGKWVKGAAGSGVMPWALRTAGEAAHAVANSPAGRFAKAAQPGYAASAVGGAAGVGASLSAAALAELKQSLTSGESKRVFDMRRKGMSESDALATIAQEREAKK